MPTFNRRTLRQHLGTSFWLADTVLGTTTGSWGTTASLTVVDTVQIDATATEEQMHRRAWIRLLGSAGSNQDGRVASFDCLTGKYVTLVTAATLVYSGQPFEVHDALSPTDKDNFLNETVGQLRASREVPVWTIDGAHVYTLPAGVCQVNDVYYFSDPTSSLDRGVGKLTWWSLAQTATGAEVRIEPALAASQQLILDAIVTLTLGAADTATINIPDEDWLLAGAAARCLAKLEAGSPGKEATAYRSRRLDAAKTFLNRCIAHQPRIQQQPKLDKEW